MTRALWSHRYAPADGGRSVSCLSQRRIEPAGCGCSASSHSDGGDASTWPPSPSLERPPPADRTPACCQSPCLCVRRDDMNWANQQSDLIFNIIQVILTTSCPGFCSTHIAHPRSTLVLQVETPDKELCCFSQRLHIRSDYHDVWSSSRLNPQPLSFNLHFISQTVPNKKLHLVIPQVFNSHWLVKSELFFT